MSKYVDYELTSEECAYRNVATKDNKYKFQSCKGKWIDSNNKEWKLKDMSYEYLLNSIRKECVVSANDL